MLKKLMSIAKVDGLLEKTTLDPPGDWKSSINTYMVLGITCPLNSLFVTYVFPGATS